MAPDILCYDGSLGGCRERLYCDRAILGLCKESAGEYEGEYNEGLVLHTERPVIYAAADLV